MKSIMKRSFAILISILLVCQMGIFAWADDELTEEDPQPVETVQEVDTEIPLEQEQEDAEAPAEDIQSSTDEDDEIMPETQNEQPADLEPEGTPEEETELTIQEKQLSNPETEKIQEEKSLKAAGDSQDEGVSWNLENGILTISGNGPMVDYTASSLPPWFPNSDSIKSIIVEHGITHIGERAFLYCSKATNATLPDSVTSIGYGAFNECSSLKSITIPNSVTSIGEWAFGGCKSLTNITLPNSVTSIGNYIFQNCSSLKSVTLPNNVTSIVQSEFSNCTSLTSITIPDSVTSIGYGAFNNCSSLKSITLPDSVTSIDNYAFAGCSSLTSITIPEGVTSIGDNAFSTGIFLYVNEGSYAELYVKDKQIKYDLTSGHTIKEWFFSSGTACTEPGVMTGICSTCGASLTKEIPVEGHIWSEEYIVDKKPSITEDGLKSIRCIKCNQVKEGSEIIIEKIRLKDVRVEAIPDQDCTGRRIEPNIQVYLRNDKLILDEDYTISFSNNIKVGTASVKVQLSEQFGNAVINVKFNIVDNPDISPDEMGYLLTVNAGQSIKHRYFEGEKVTVQDLNEVVYKTFESWKIVSGELSLTTTQKEQRKITFTMPGSDVKIKAIYTGTSLSEDLETENNRHKAIVLRASSLKTNIKTYTNTANSIMNSYGVSNLQSISYYENMAASTEDTLTKRQNYLAALRSDTSGGHQVEIKQLEAEIQELQAEYQMYLELRTAAQYMKQAQDAQAELNRIDLDAETLLHNNNVAAICEEHGVIDSSVAEIECIRLDKDEYDYTGKEIHPTVSVYDSNGKKLGNESYSVTYPKDCTSPGKHTITLNLKGSYVGKKTKVFTIIKHEYGDWVVIKEPTLTEEGLKKHICKDCGRVELEKTPKLTVKATSITKVPTASKGFTVKWKKISGVTGYEIQYATNSKFTKGKKTVKITKASTVSKKITKLKAKKKYYVRIRAYKTYKGKKYYSKWSKASKVTTKK